jgi:hypothetical protein
MRTLKAVAARNSLIPGYLSPENETFRGAPLLSGQ